MISRRHPSTPAADPTTGSVRSMYRRLRMGGLDAREAGNLTAHLTGLRVVPHGWTVQEIERLLFVRELVRLRRMGS